MTSSKLLARPPQRLTVAVLFLLVAATGSLIVVSGCSDDLGGVTEPELSGVPEQPQSSFAVPADGVVEVNPDEPIGAGEVVTGRTPKSVVLHWQRSITVRSGDTTLFPLSREMSLAFPPGAVDEDLPVTADVWVLVVLGKTAWIMFEFSPSAEFAVPVSLTVKQGLISGLAFPGGLYALWYLNADALMWELADVSWNNRGWVTFELEHFSKYAIGR
jgi:hypothetical protein